MNKKVSRRTFLKSAAVGTTGLLAVTLLDKSSFPKIIRASQARTLTVGVIPGQPADHFNLMAKNYMAAHSDVTIQVNVASGAEQYWKPNFPQIVSSSDKPDLAWYWVDGRAYQDIANAGLLEPLDDLYQSEGWDKALPESVINTYTSPDGKKYAVCETIVWYPQVYYSKEAFSKAGLEPPKDYYYKSLDEFYGVCDKLRTAGYEPVTIGGGEGWILGHTHDALLQRVATEDQLNDLLTSWRKGATPKVKYTDAPWATADKLLVEFNQKKVFAEGYLGRTYADGRALFVQGKAAMYQDGSWAPSDGVLYKEAPKLDFGWMLYPQVDPKIQPKFLLYGGNGLMIPKGGPNVDLAKQFLAFVMSKDQQETSAKAKINFPSRNDIPLDAIKASGSHVADMYPYLTSIGASTGWDDPVPADMAEQSLTMWGDLLSGRISVDQVGQQLEKLADAHRKG